MTNWVFAYGSLMNHKEIKRSLQSFSPDKVAYAILRGYRRDWSACRDNLNNPVKRVADNLSNVPPPFVANLNISHTAREQDEVYGVCLQVSNNDLKQFDLREAGYTRVEVSSRIEFSGKPIGADDCVYAYASVTGTEAPDREASYDYLNLLLDTCRALNTAHPGILGNYLNRTPLPDARLAEHALFYFNADFTRLYEVTPDSSEEKLLAHHSAGERPAALNISFDTFESKSGHLAAFIDNCSHHGIVTPDSVSVRAFREMLVRLADAEDPTSMHTLGWKERRLIAQMPFASGCTLIALSTDKSFMVRMAAAGNPATPASALATLRSDCDPWVRAAAQARN